MQSVLHHASDRSPSGSSKKRRRQPLHGSGTAGSEWQLTELGTAHMHTITHQVVLPQCCWGHPYTQLLLDWAPLRGMGSNWRWWVISLCNPRDHCTHSLFQDYCIVKLITPNRLTYLHTGTTLWRGIVLYALVLKTMHGIIVGKRVRTRRLSDRYCTRVWMNGMIWCDH